MRLNTTKSLKLARHVKGRFGTWNDVRRAARVEDGVYVLEPAAALPADEPLGMKRPAAK